MNASAKLFGHFEGHGLTLRNHIVMAPMTRSRAIGNIPNELMVEYYSQRSGAGLIITEGTAPSPDGLGYARIPGIFSKEQVAGWKAVTDAVHNNGGKIFIQLMHTGRISHPANMPSGAKVVSASAIQAAGEMWTDSEGMQPHPVPHALSITEINETVAAFVSAAKNAIDAGFDGVELHGANGYLIEQFIRPTSNTRIDQYGGNTENYARFALEVCKAVAEAIGKEKTAIRLSPYGVFNDMPYDSEMDAIYMYLVKELNKLGVLYIHLVDHSSMGAPKVPQAIKASIRKAFNRILILSGGYNADLAEKDLNAGNADLIAFGRPFIANPDLVDKYRNGLSLITPDFNTFYTPGEKGYTDYPKA
jgi:N-ethylmaleimide reductase